MRFSLWYEPNNTPCEVSHASTESPSTYVYTSPPTTILNGISTKPKTCCRKCATATGKLNISYLYSKNFISIILNFLMKATCYRNKIVMKQIYLFTVKSPDFILWAYTLLVCQCGASIWAFGNIVYYVSKRIRIELKVYLIIWVIC